MTESNNRQDSVRHYIKRDTAQARAYSQAVVTKGGRTVWLAGQVGAVDASGKSLAGDLDANRDRQPPPARCSGSARGGASRPCGPVRRANHGSAPVLRPRSLGGFPSSVQRQ